MVEHDIGDTSDSVPREPQESLRALIETSRDWIWGLDTAFFLTYSNPAVEEILGYHPDELIGKHTRDLMHPDDAESLRETLERCVVEKRGWEGLVVRWRHRDGSYRYLESNSVPVLDDEGNLAGFQGVDHDVTDRRRVQQEAERNRSLLRSVLDMLPTHICAKNLDGRFLLVNKTLTDFYGTTVDEMTGLLHSDICEDEEELKSMLAADRAVIEGQHPVLIPEETMQKPDGSITWLQTTKIPFRADEEPAVLIASQDITRRKQAELALLRSEALLNASQRLARIGGWEWNLTTETMTWTAETYRIHGVEPGDNAEAPESHIARSVKCYDEADRPAVLAAFRKCAATGESYDLEFPFTTYKGERLWIRTAADAVREGGKVTRLVGVIMDVTERKSMQSRLEKSEAHYRLLAESTLDVIWTMDTELAFTYVNPAITLLTGHTPKEWTGTRLSEHCTSAACATMGDAIEELLRRGPTDQRGIIFETELLRKDGSEVSVEIHGRAMFDSNGRPVMFQGTTRDITERKQAYAELAKQKEMFELVINSAPINIFWKDTNSVYTGCNAKFVRSAGKNGVGDIIGKTDQDLVWGGEAQKYLDDDSEVLTTGTPKLKYEETYTLPDGSEVWWQTNKLPLRDRSGAVIGLLAISEDITERKQAEQALRRERDRLNYVLEASRIGTWAWDIEANSAEFNEMWATLLGYTMEEIGPSSYELWKSLGHPDDVPKIEALLQRCANGEMPDYSSEFRMRHKDGHWVWILDRGRVMTHDAEGRPLEIFGTHTDISPLMRAQEELRESEAKFRSYIEQAPYGVFIADATGNYVDVNPAASRIAGYARDELLTMGIRDLIAPDDQEDGAAHFAQVVEQGAAEGVIPFVRKDGTWRLWNVTAVRLSEERILCFVQDVTEQQQMEEQIRKSQKLDAVGQLAGGVAHDFNNLLMGIMNYVELCRDEIGQEHPIRKWLDEITHESERSAAIVRQLLAFSRKQTIAPRVLDLNHTVGNMLKMLRRLIGEDIDLLWQPGANLRPIKMDPGQVDQILANLSVNARDAIGGVGKITIETANVTLDADYCAFHTEVTPGDFVMLAFSDSGSGMNAETQANVFEPFFTTKVNGEGTGLGLATVYGIVKQNGGSINLYSEPGNGTTFRIYLPCTADTAEGASTQDRPHEVSGGKETILLVEDEKSIRITTSLFLKDLGYNVLVAETPAEALQIVEKHNGEIDALITDVVMPGMNGRQLAERLEVTCTGLKVLYVSGYTVNVIVHRGVLEEGVEFLSKPITRDVLAHKLRHMLDGSENGKRS